MNKIESNIMEHCDINEAINIWEKQAQYFNKGKAIYPFWENKNDRINNTKEECADKIIEMLNIPGKFTAFKILWSQRV